MRVGKITALAGKGYPVDYSRLNIMGYAVGAQGAKADPDHAASQNLLGLHFLDG
ncbi:MAG: hypothetical protein HWN68_15540 [Desulfobacterales bacterium]|nr:hypothetical protein [Desulfobacterales bacterium]